MYLYILKISNNSYYVGSTTDLQKRMMSHKRGANKYTRKFLPFDLVFSQGFSSSEYSRKIEYWIKKQKSRKLIEKIIFEGRITHQID